MQNAKAKMENDNLKRKTWLTASRFAKIDIFKFYPVILHFEI